MIVNKIKTQIISLSKKDVPEYSRISEKYNIPSFSFYEETPEKYKFKINNEEYQYIANIYLDCDDKKDKEALQLILAPVMYNFINGIFGEPKKITKTDIMSEIQRRVSNANPVELASFYQNISGKTTKHDNQHYFISYE